MENDYKAIYDIDECLVGPSGSAMYRMRDAIALREKLGRPLTEEEMKAFYLGEDPEVDDSIAI